MSFILLILVCAASNFGLARLFIENENFIKLPKIKQIQMRAIILLPLITYLGIATTHFFAMIAFILFLFGDIAATKDVKFSIPIFALSHIFMITALIPFLNITFDAVALVIIIGALLFVMRDLFKIKSFGLKVAVFSYAAIIAIPIVLILLSVQSFPLLILGVGYYAFFFSDVVLAENAFVKPSRFAFTHNSFWYYIGIWLIFIGLLIL